LGVVHVAAAEKTQNNIKVIIITMKLQVKKQDSMIIEFVTESWSLSVCCL